MGPSKRWGGGALLGACAAVVVAGAMVVTGPVAGATTASTWTPAQSTASAVHGTWAATTIASTSCPTPGYCVSVGYSTTTYGKTPGKFPRYFGLVGEVFSGGQWTAASLPLPGNAKTGADSQSALYGVSCSGSGACVAVGKYALAANGTSQGLIEVLSGTTWTALQAPTLPNVTSGAHQYAILYDVSCPASGSCMAVGQYTNNTDNLEALVDTLSGGSWSATTMPVPSDAASGKHAESSLTRVTCLSVGSCVATGTFATTADGLVGLIEQLSGTAWTPVHAPLGYGSAPGSTQFVFLRGVTCWAAGSCVVVGSYRDATINFVGLIDTLSGGTWTGVRAPEPPNPGMGITQTATLTSVSCPAGGACVAVGGYRAQNGGYLPMIDTLAAGTWSASEPPLPSGTQTDSNATSGFSQVSCTAPGRCAAVGTYLGTTDFNYGLIGTLTGGAWSTETAPIPSSTPVATAQSTRLDTVDCVAGGCAAGGTYDDAHHITQGLLETTGMAPAGYFEAASDGGIFAFTVPFHGSMGGKPLNAPIVTAAADPLTGGYYEVAADGGMFAFTAPFHGSMGGKPLNKPIVGMAFDTRTGGYYEVASDGGLFAFTAPFLGSMGGKPLNEPIVGMAFDPATGGYWEVASDGGLFAFTAPFKGSMGGKPLVKPIVGMAYDSLTGGYYEVATDGGLFAFTAPFHGSMGGQPLNEPVVGMAFDYGTGGYWEVASDGGLFAFTAPFKGSMGGKPLNEPIVTMALG